MKKSLSELLGVAMAWFLMSIAAMLVIDGLMFLLVPGNKFGDMSGWLALVGPAIIFAGQFRESKGAPGRWVALLLAVVCGLGLGMMAANLFYLKLPALITGAVGAFVATVVFAAVWHAGLLIAAKAQS